MRNRKQQNYGRDSEISDVRCKPGFTRIESNENQLEDNESAAYQNESTIPPGCGNRSDQIICRIGMLWFPMLLLCHCFGFFIHELCR